jgi:site-specific DNA recombinase
MKKYLAYVRVSTVKQGERGSSLVEQKSAIEAYAARYGLSIFGWFEEMETAAKRGRREFTRMLRILKSGKADGLIVHKIDRSARNLRDWAELGDLIDRGLDIRFASDNFDMLSRGGRLSADIQAVVAADYIRNLREEVKKGLYGRLKQGLYPWAAPLGYLNTGITKITGTARPKMIDPEKGPLVREMFELYAKGQLSLRDLGPVMAEKGLSARSGKPFDANRLSEILNNPFYMGVIRVGSTRETFTGAHIPLVSTDMFESVQAILHRRTTPKWRKHEFALRQLVRCGSCERRTLTGEMQKGVAYYRCHGRDCAGVSWRADVLEALAQDHVRRICIDPGGLGDLGDMVEEEERRLGETREDRKATLTLKLGYTDERVGRLTDLLLDGAIDTATYRERKERLLMEKQGLREQLARDDTASPLKELYQRFERQNGQLLRYETLSVDQKREMLQIIGSNFFVRGKNAVFTLQSPYQEIAEFEDSDECGHLGYDVRTRHVFEVFKIIAERTGESERSGTNHVPQVPKSTRSSAAGRGRRGDDELAATA